MISKSKTARMIRLAPLAASLTTIAFIAACARTNGKTQISPEAKGKIADFAEMMVPGYDLMKSTPENMDFAKRFKGASIVVNSRDDKTQAINATIKVIFNDATPDFILSGDMVGGHKDAGQKTLKFGKDGDDLTMTAQCISTKCAAVLVEIDSNKEDTTVQAVVAADQAAGAGAGLSGSYNIAGAVQTPAADPVVAADAPTALPKPAQAPIAGAPKKMVKSGIFLITFAVDGVIRKEKSPIDTGDTKATAKVIIPSTMSILKSTPTEVSKVSGVLETYEIAYREKYKTDAPADPTKDPACLVAMDNTINCALKAPVIDPVAAQKAADAKAAADAKSTADAKAAADAVDYSDVLGTRATKTPVGAKPADAKPTADAMTAANQMAVIDAPVASGTKADPKLATTTAK